jgi:hypothetical protein
VLGTAPVTATVAVELTRVMTSAPTEYSVKIPVARMLIDATTMLMTPMAVMIAGLP